MKKGYAFVVGDLVHYGHLRFLIECKKHCDFLIVGVYTDELTASYKRVPIIPFWERIQMIRALRLVDMVVKVENRDQSIPMKRLCEEGHELKYLFHGDDWDAEKDEDMKSSKIFIESVGGELIQPKYYEGQSTTKIIEKIMNREVD